jgi:hypothetical protein
LDVPHLDKKEHILERQKKFTGSEKNGGKIMGINQFLDTEFLLLPHHFHQYRV